jgi:predicted ArsR family transcriptional regulator
MISISIREQILNYLASYSTASTLELSDVLHVTKPGIQYHLKLLMEDELVERIDIPKNRKSAGRGRPINYYRLSRHSKPDHLERLVCASLAIFLQLQQDTDAINFLQRLAEQVFVDADKHASLPMKLKKAVEEFNRYDYLANWEARHKGPVIQFKNCPYKSIWLDHPELCEMDRLGVERLTQLEARQVTCIHQAEPYSASCLFYLHGE